MPRYELARSESEEEAKEEGAVRLFLYPTTKASPSVTQSRVRSSDESLLAESETEEEKLMAGGQCDMGWT